MNIYQELGVEPLINASGARTVLGGSIMEREVLEAMAAAGQHFIDMHELQRAAGQRIADLVGVEAARICACASAGITLMAAACMTGDDPKKIAQLPDTIGITHLFVVQDVHRNPFDHAVETAGGRFLEISPSSQELEEVLGDGGVAAVYYPLTWFYAVEAIPLQEVVRIAHAAGVPVLVDAASQTPPIGNLSRFVQEGADLVVFSGGKAIRGPQSSGLILGRKELVEACVLNDSPNVQTIARGMKMGKEEIVGLVKAIELYYQKDHAAEMALWYGRIETIEIALSHLTGIRLERRMPDGIGCQIPFLSVSWDESELGKTHRSVVDELEKGNPPIVVTLVGPESPRVVRPELWFLVHSLQDGEAEIVARCIREILATFSKC